MATAAVVLGVGVIGGVAAASSTTSEGIVSVAPHTVANGTAIAANKSLTLVVSGAATTVPTDATRVQFSVTVSTEQQPGTLTAAPYLDAADASADSLSWPAANTSVSGTFLEPVGVANKVSFTNASTGTVHVFIKIIGYSTPARLAGQIDSLAATVNSLSARLATDEAELAALPRLTMNIVSHTPGFYVGDDSGANLKPGSIVTLHWVVFSGQASQADGTVAADGTFGREDDFGCMDTNVYLTGFDVAGNPVTSNLVVKGAGCS